MFENITKQAFINLLAEGKIDMSVRDVLTTLKEHFGVTDFTHALRDTAHLSAMKGFNKVEPLWKKLVSTAPKNDFKVNYLVGVEGMGTLDSKIESEPYYERKPTDSSENYTIARYGNVFPLSFEAKANDATGLLNKYHRQWGAAAANTLNKFVLNTMINDNPPTTRGTNLFSSTNANAAGDVDLNHANLVAGYEAMMAQTDDNSDPMELMPRYLLCHPADAEVAYSLTRSTSLMMQTHATGTAAKETTYNWMNGMLEVIVSGWITSGYWFLVADPNIYDVFEMGFYQGRQEPEVFMQTPESDAAFFKDVIYSKCRLIFGGAPADPRCFYGAGFAV